MSIEAMKKAVKVIMGFRSGFGDDYPSYEEVEAVADLRIAINKAENPENFLDAIDRAYHEGKKAGIAEANAVNDVAKTEQKHNFCSDCGKFMPEGGIHTCSPQVKQQFYPDWDMIKPLTERIAELEAQLHELGKGCAECGKKESDGWALYCVDCVEKASKPEQEPVAKYSDIVSDGGLDPRNKYDTAQVEQQYVAWVKDTGNEFKILRYDTRAVNKLNDGDRLYTAPPRKEWVGLTDEQIRLMAHNDDDNDWDDLHHKYVWHEGYLEGARAAETELREKNG